MFCTGEQMFPQTFNHAKGKVPSSLPVAFHEDDGEFVAPVAGNSVHFTDRIDKNSGEFLQRDVPGGVEKSVVVTFKIIQVEHQQGEGFPVPPGPEDFLFELVVEIAPVVKSGQGIEEGIKGKRSEEHTSELQSHL